MLRPVSPLFRLSSLVVLLAAILAGTAAEAQIIRPSESVYVLLRGAAAGYYGDLQSTSGSGTFDRLTDGFDNPGFGVGGEVGYHVADDLSIGLGFWYQDLPALNNGLPVAGTVNRQGGEAYQGQLLARYLPFAAARVTPYVELGAAVVFGQGTENERGRGTAGEDVIGFGPVVGLGIDAALTPRLGLFLGAQSTFVVPDVALDGADRGAVGGAPGSDDADLDILANLGGGLRFAFRGPVTAVGIQGLECPAELETGETGTFTAFTNTDATAPVTASWQWGDGTTGSGLTARHAYDAPGTYTVTATARNGGGTDAESCLVTVTEPPVLPALAACRATPTTVGEGEAFTVDATVTDADEVSVDFGDGTTGTTLPARHTYDQAGTYAIAITVSNAFGVDTCSVQVTVAVDDSCLSAPSELNPVFFDYGSSALTASARDRLDENIDLLRRCASVCVAINGYSDGDEPGGAQRLASARAEAVRAYYLAQGLESSRFTTAGRGVSPGANSKEDPGPGDARARRADSIPGPCDRF